MDRGVRVATEKMIDAAASGSPEELERARGEWDAALSALIEQIKDVEQAARGVIEAAEQTELQQALERLRERLQ